MKKLDLSTVLLAAAVVTTTALRAQTTGWVSLVTAQVKLDTELTRRIYIADINNDHYPDIVTVRSGDIAAENNLRVYLNTAASGGRIFADITAASGVNASPAGSVSRGISQAALADVNNDGNIDLVRGNYYGTTLSTYTDYGDRCEVLLGDGTGHFTLVPNNGLHELGLINPMGFTFLDYNKDGNIDLFIAPWFKEYDADIWQAGYLMKGNGDGTFTNVTSAAGMGQQEPMFGSCAVDWNNDGWADIATAPYCRTGGQLWKNNGDGTFTNVALQAGYNSRYMQGDNGQNLCMWGSMPEDYDNDGDMDFFFSLVHGGNDAGEGHSTIVMNKGVADGYGLLWSMGRITWKSPQSPHHGDYDASWFDLDNDGLEDIVMTQGHYVPPTDRLFVFHQDQGHAFTDITQEIGLLAAEMKDGHMVEVFDYDLDGDDDILFCQVSSGSLHLIRNDIGHTHNWTAVRLSAPAGVNKDCIGARIYVWSGGVKHMREVYAGRGNAAGQQPFAMIFGLGGNTAIDSVQVRWPDPGNTVTTVRRPPVNRYLQITGTGLSVPGAPDADTVILKVYPNPAQDFILVQLSDNTAVQSVEVYNMTGMKTAAAKLLPARQATIYYPVKDLPAGQYIVSVITTTGETFSKTFMKAPQE